VCAPLPGGGEITGQDATRRAGHPRAGQTRRTDHFQAVQREAGVSHAFLHNHPDPRKRNRAAAGRARLALAPVQPAGKQSTLVLALTIQITRLKQQHGQEVQALREALERAHGENVDLRRELTRRGWTGMDSN
jgi:hypothetical protein